MGRVEGKVAIATGAPKGFGETDARVDPAGMDTPMVRGMGKKMADAPPPPTTAVGAAEDIAYAVLYLASDESRFVNCQKLVVDNALTVTPAVVPA